MTVRDQRLLAGVLLLAGLLPTMALILASAPEFALDFPEFYVAGRIASDRLYDPAAFGQLGRDLLPHGISYIPPYVRPAAFAWPLRPVMRLPYWSAFAVWSLAQVALLAASLGLLATLFPVPSRLLAVLASFFPAVFGIFFGQDPATALFVFCLGLYLLNRQCDVAAGIVLSLALYKFNLALLVPLFLLLRKRYRALIGFVSAGAVLATISVVSASPVQYVRRLLTLGDLPGFLPARMISLRSLMLTVGGDLGQVLMAVLLVIVVIAFAWFIRRADDSAAFSVLVLSSLLCSYHANGYDATLALIPMTAGFASSRRALNLAAVACFLLLGKPPLWLSPLLLLAMLAVFVWAEAAHDPREKRA